PGFGSRPVGASPPGIRRPRLRLSERGRRTSVDPGAGVRARVDAGAAGRLGRSLSLVLLGDAPGGAQGDRGVPGGFPAVRRNQRSEIERPPHGADPLYLPPYLGLAQRFSAANPNLRPSRLDPPCRRSSPNRSPPPHQPLT